MAVATETGIDTQIQSDVLARGSELERLKGIVGGRCLNGLPTRRDRRRWWIGAETARHRG